MNSETTALILSGGDYSLHVSPEAHALKQAILSASSDVMKVDDKNESSNAAHHVRKLASLRILVEKSRKEVKAPVLETSRMIDQIANSFLSEFLVEETRIKNLMGDYAESVAELARQREIEERKAFDAARLARETAEAAQEAAEQSNRISDIINAKKAAEACQEALTAKFEASSELAATKVADGVRFVWDFEVISMKDLQQGAPEFVKVEYKRREILAWLKSLEENEDRDAAAIASQIGILAYKIPSISTR